MKAENERVKAPHYLPLLPDFLFQADRGIGGYVVRAWLLALVPSILISVAVNLLLPDASVPPMPVERGAAFLVPLLVLVAPFVETLLMAPPLLLLNRLLGPAPAVIGSALLWGLLHASVAPAWGLITWWPFLVLSVAFLTWRPRGLGAAIGIATAIHALQNSVAAAMLFAMPMLG